MNILKDAVSRRILVLDGAMGTALQDKNLTADDFGGKSLEGCNENLVLTRPDVISDVHEAYLLAGADIVETNTFGGTPLVLEEYEIGKHAFEINKRAAEIARAAAERHSTSDKPRFVAGSIGPTTKAISVTGGITFEELVKNFYAQGEGLVAGGIDYFLIETCQDTRNTKACLLALDQLNKDKSQNYPIAVSVTLEPTGTMLAGQSIEALLTSLNHLDLLYLGMNCATGPEFMTDHIRSLSKLCRFPIACVPNAGLPDEEGNYLESPEMVAEVIGRFIKKGWINLVGGCCGTTPPHIKALSDLANRSTPRIPEEAMDKVPENDIPSYLSGVDFLEVNNEVRPVIVGERTNVIGSRKFKRLICEGKFDEASDIARAQIKKGAQIVDVCLANPDREELEDVKTFFEQVVKKVRVPFMIDSTDSKVIELALTYSQGKAIINSVNMEDGEERFESVCPLANRFGAALVVGTIDDDKEQGMGVTKERKLEIATRSYKLLTEKYGIKAEDIYWDPLVFPCATGDKQYVGSAVETIEGIKLIKDAFPGTKTVLGISNVSFGLPDAGREVLNSVFLYHCVQSGLDLAIVNSEKLERYSNIPQEEKKLSDDLLWNRGDDPIAAFANHFRERKVKSKVEKSKIPLDERLANYIVEGSKDGLVEDIDERLKDMIPLDIINGPLMKGMDEVGRLFNKNELIVAEVLQSAEAMKAAVAHLEPHMEKSEATSRGKVMLATVKGDVHDIGKNLVEIILSNNGFEVINLGIKVPSDVLIQELKKHEPDIVGLSGLLVKSAQQMVATADDFARAGVDTPIMVGGAALSSNFVDKKISKAYTGGTVVYAKDAMNGLDLAKSIMDKDEFSKLKKKIQERREKLEASLENMVPIQLPKMSTKRSTQISLLDTLPSPPDFRKHVIKNTPIEQIWSYINPLMLFGRHLGVKGGIARKLDDCLNGKGNISELEASEPSAYKILIALQELKEEYKNTEILQPSATYQFFQVQSEGNKTIFSTEKNLNGNVFLEFSRQRSEDGLCLSDYVHPEKPDSMAMFVTTVGKGIRELAERLKERGDYLKSHIIQVLALESAEAYAELMHGQIRKTWGFPDSPDMTMMQRFQSKYRGARFSFGYPACPRLDDQEILFSLLKPTEIGVQLTDGQMMDPEASVSAIVFHHPDAKYFSIGASEDNR